MDAFSDRQTVARYADGPPRLVPGFASLQRMIAILIAEHGQQDAHILVLGAGGGLEIKAFADTHPGLQFDGVDPSAAMLDVARETLGPLAERARLREGLIDVAPGGPFDAATCILTMHFVERNERLRTRREVHRRLKPGAPFAVAHFCFPQGAGERKIWISRYAAFAAASGVDPVRVESARPGISARLPILSLEEDEGLLREAGFRNVGLFYTAFKFRGWVANA
jgi:tRNA (cmo5U34)-methyltransferase